MAGWATFGCLHGLGQPATFLLLVRHPSILFHLGGFAFFELGPRPSVDRHLLIEGICSRRILRQIESSFEWFTLLFAAECPHPGVSRDGAFCFVALSRRGEAVVRINLLLGIVAHDGDGLLLSHRTGAIRVKQDKEIPKHRVMVFCGNVAAWAKRAWLCFSFGFPVADKVVESLMLGTGLGHLRWSLRPQSQGEYGEKKAAECGCAFHRCPPERHE